MANRPKLLTIQDVTESMQIGRTKVYELIHSGELPVVYIGRSPRIPAGGVDQWIERNRRGPGDESEESDDELIEDTDEAGERRLYRRIR